MLSCQSVGLEDHFGGGEHGVGAVSKVRGASVAVTAFDCDGVPTVGLDLCDRGIRQSVGVWAFGDLLRGRRLFSGSGIRDGVLVLYQSEYYLVPLLAYVCTAA